MIGAFFFVLGVVLESSLLVVTILQCSGKKNDKNKNETKKPNLDKVDADAPKQERLSNQTDGKDNESDTSLVSTDVGEGYENLSYNSNVIYPAASETMFGTVSVEKSAEANSSASNTTPSADSLLKSFYNMAPSQSSQTSNTQQSITQSITESEGSEMIEAPFSIEPEELQFPTTGDSKRILLRNTTDQRLALKVKCTNNAMYRIEPVYSIVEPQNECEFEVFRLRGGDAKTDRLVVMYSNIENTDIGPFKHFQTPGIETHRKNVPLISVAK